MSNWENGLVQVKQGRLQGCEDSGVKVFRGIPYAAPPVGERRFKAPADPGSWRGTRDATKFGAASIQVVMEPSFIQPASQYEEDCLYLNVWTPAKSENEKLPVFMWIHGGGLVAGSGVETVCRGAEFAREKGVVVVTINYRLGFFGFFSHPELTAETDEHFSGNYGLLDMRKAAMWIQENISAFSGDPDNVTIAGQSGGAAACGAILASPLMKGLYHHICIESGPVYWGFMMPPARETLEQRGVSFMEQAGCKNISELRKKHAWELYDLYIKNNNIMTFNFCTDGWFLPDEIHDMMERGEFNDVDVLIGSNSQEFSVSGPNGISVEDFHKYLEKVFPDNAETMKAWYPAKTAVIAAKQAATVASDVMLMGSVRIGQLCAKYGRKAFVFLNTKETENEQGKAFGCPHCAEMPYLFGCVGKGGPTPFHDYQWVDKDFAFMHQIMGYWSNFAKSGNPNGDGLVQWKQYEKDYDVMALGNESQMADQSRVKPLYDYYISRLMKDVHGDSNQYYMAPPHLNV